MNKELGEELCRIGFRARLAVRLFFCWQIVLLIAVLIYGCPYSKNGRWRGDFEHADLIGMCRQLNACAHAGDIFGDVFGASAEGWDRCSLRCGCLSNTASGFMPGLEYKDGLYWTDRWCQP